MVYSVKIQFRFHFFRLGRFLEKLSFFNSNDLLRINRFFLAIKQKGFYVLNLVVMVGKTRNKKIYAFDVITQVSFNFL